MQIFQIYSDQTWRVQSHDSRFLKISRFLTWHISFSSPPISSSLTIISSCLSIHLSFLPSLLSRPDEEIRRAGRDREMAANVTRSYLKWPITFKVIYISQSAQGRLKAFRKTLWVRRALIWLFIWIYGCSTVSMCVSELKVWTTLLN